MTETIKSGDVIIMQAETTSGNALKLIDGLFSKKNLFTLSHACLAYRCPITNQLYVWEVGVVGDESFIISVKGRHKNWTHLSLWDEKMKTFEGTKVRVFVRRLKNKFNKSLDQKLFSYVVAKNLRRKYDWSLKFIIDRNSMHLLGSNEAIINTIFKDEINNRWHCGAFVIHAFYDANLMKHSVIEDTDQILPYNIFFMPSEGYSWCKMKDGFYLENPELILDFYPKS